MAQIETWYNQDLKQPVKVHYLHGNVFSQDNQGNILGVNVFDDGSPASLSGTVNAYIIRSDGATVPATGTLSGNKASVALPEAAYAIPGIISVVLKLTAGAVVVTLLAVVATVYASSTDTAVDPGTIIPSIADLIAEINAAVASIPADYSDLWTSLAPEYSTGSAYRFGDYVVYNGGLYKNIVPISSGESWTAAHWAAVTLGNELTFAYGATKFTDDLQNAKREGRKLSVSLSDITMYKKGYYMDGNGALSAVPNHSVHVIEDAETINQIRFVQLANASGMLFVVVDSTGAVRKTYNPSSTSFTNFQYSCFIVPGGLPAGSKIYVNYFYENDNHAKVVTDIELYFEPQLKGKPHGSDLFSREKALELSGSYYDYTNGSQTKSSTYCTGEARISAGDTFIVSRNCHIAYYGEYGSFISGDLNTSGWYATFTAPTGTVGAYVSFKISEMAEVECLIDEIHFTVPINQKILNDGEGSATYVDDESEIINVNAVMKLPQGYTENGTPTPLIAIFHGAGFYVSSSNWGVYAGGAEGTSADFDNMTRYFVYNGYAVCDINAYDNTIPNRTFGSQRTILAYKKLIEYVKNHYNVEQLVNGFGFSMGGLVALNYINEFSNDLKCLALASPVVALYDQGYYGSATWKTAIANSYCFDVPSGFEFSSGTPTAQEVEIWNTNASLTKGYDPYVRVDTNIANTRYPFMRIWHGDSDTAVSYLKSNAFSNEVRNRLVDCTYRLITGAGHEICYGANAVCLREYVRFFNRFNFITGIVPR